jgi:hypothetical protein
MTHRCGGEGLTSAIFKLFLAILVPKYDWKIFGKQRTELNWGLFFPTPADNVKIRFFEKKIAAMFVKELGENPLEYEVTVQTGPPPFNPLTIFRWKKPLFFAESFLFLFLQFSTKNRKNFRSGYER